MSYLVAKSTDTGIFSSDESAFHGLKVNRNTGATDEGSLTYTKTYINDPSASVSLADFGIPYNGIDDVNAGTASRTNDLYSAKIAFVILSMLLFVSSEMKPEIENSSMSPTPMTNSESPTE